MPTPVVSTIRTLVVECPADAGDTIELVLNERIRTVSIQGLDSSGTVGTACFYSLLQGQTEGDAIDSNRFTVQAGGLLPVIISGRARALGGTSLFVASSVPDGIVELIINVEPLT